ncbi:MAG TPA: adenylyltransferase/cytidyltransferase family protein [Candidatus Goldiibacteriota bacterium]|nr:adenylyltransferase/cytidyltransferase family protein [Candidatus Goldiibacteriota bacterium]HPN64652.1 adenylyltransferase/cytidyltransferase family protein [Candidatus Goldiibacteriota bacterium]HRQ44196.1 adenylyltransferase/cytidyltransferase family protein [Candidatus Goldiibacteriota bacterium]
MPNKIMTREKIGAVAAKLKKKGKKVVFANGCFDILHVGHVRFLKGAKAKGDILVLGLNSDASVRKLKGKGRPLVNQRDRAELMAAFEFVDYVTVFGEQTVEKTLRIIKPDYHAKGTDYTKDTVPEKGIAKELGIKIAIVGDKKNHSTKDIIKTITERYGCAK